MGGLAITVMASEISFGNCNSGLQVGSSNALITAHFHVQNEQPETPPSPLSTVPFRRDKEFVECGTIFDEINEKNPAPSPRIALVGLGGVGKSKLAIEYSYRIRERSPETWVFWVHASNAARFEQSFREIADRVKISGRENPTSNIFQLVHDWLQDERKGKWALILDNVDDDRFLQQAPLIKKDDVGQDSDQKLWRPLQAYLPQSPHGLILMTTRNKGVALRMVEEREIIIVQPMDQAHAKRLFEAKLGIQENPEEFCSSQQPWIICRLQSAAYIKQRAPRSSVKQYLQQFQSSDNSKLTLLEYEKGQLRRDREARNSVIRTWQISFDYLRQERPSAANLLSLMSFFNRQAIHESLLPIHNQGANDGTIQKVNVKDEDSCLADVEDPREEDFCTLRDYSFITVNTDAVSFAMHRLVQLATQKWLEEHGELEKWRGQCIANLLQEFPFTAYQDWRKRDMILQHFVTATAHQRDPEASSTMEVVLLCKAAMYTWQKGNFVEAEEMHEKAKKVIEARRLLSEDPRGEIYELIKAGYEELLGDDHPDTLAALGNVATALGGQRKYAEAEPLLRKAVAGHEKKLGVEDPTTLGMYLHLGIILEIDETICERIFEPEHPLVLRTMEALGMALSGQGRYQEVVEMHRWILAVQMEEAGPHSPSTLLGLEMLGKLLTWQKEFTKAEAILRETLESRRKVLGPDHLDTLTTTHSLVIALNNQGKHEEAELVEREVLAKIIKIFGSNHVETATAMSILSAVVRMQGQHSEAVGLLKTSVRILCEQIGPDEPWTVDVMSQLMDTLVCC
ncbi:uncharacterized protein ACLA_074130 [Aspergillus clavatus NRRL 1]|uniref:Uncharacterized protein n=1 Tax=Aspergillus clavatus (strain ATCC 1007 / CBS 513.65 / DSM 816 / NCTC 3887 / NRRL 1 / QM 1276 / 107) TaxID=344612 RepID=A1C7K5_ASPCL|nr:uncharacterized protein ACLA_074130 [Aspergillus clavatus NRRL 1]EAW14376.1 conserved hypothetical protein [Aspergillus clavatus NRRL 1]